MADNLEKQVDEVEVLSAIYPDHWKTIDEAARVYTIDITDDTCKDITLTLQVTLPDGYPSDSPPQYELSAPWLRGRERRELCHALDNIYLDNLGESLLFLWVTHIQQYLTERYDSRTPTSSPAHSTTPQHTTPPASPVSGESDDDGDDDADYDYEFDSSLVESSVTTEIHDRGALQCPEIHHGEFFKDRKSTFQAHLAKVTQHGHVALVMESLLENRKIAAATHNIQAYRIRKEADADVWYQGCVDDGEFQAGSRMLHLLQIVGATNVLVVVTRWYGGVHLGPDRFKHINNLTRQILLDHNMIPDKNNKKGPKSKKKGKKNT